MSTPEIFKDDGEVLPDHENPEWTRGLFKDLFKLSEGDRRLLEQWIEKYNGLIRILVHPYYEGEHHDLSEKFNKPIRSIDQTLRRLLKSAKTPPLFIIEEQIKVHDLIGRLLAVPVNPVFIIPSQVASPEPKLISPSQLYGQEFNASEENWKTLIDKLHALGIRKIIIGGMFLTIGRDLVSDPAKDKVKLHGCVGAAIDNLSNDFEIELSALTYPTVRRDIKRVEKRIQEERQEAENL